MDLAQGYIFDASWIFFAGWGVVLAAVSAIAFGRDIILWVTQSLAHSGERAGTLGKN